MVKAFISYANEDHDAAVQVQQHLQAQGIDAWFDRIELRAGDEFLKTIMAQLERADYFVILLSRLAVTKVWVTEELQMARVHEINTGRPHVVALRLDDAPVPVLLQHRSYIDARGRLAGALEELATQLTGTQVPHSTPRQAVLADMIQSSDDELWSRLARGLNATDGWSRPEVAESIRLVREQDLILAISLAWWMYMARFSHKTPSEFSLSAVIDLVPRFAKVDLVAAAVQRSLARLELDGFIEPVPNFQERGSERKIWRPAGLLWVLMNAAWRSGLFTPPLPEPKAERLSSLRASRGPEAVKGPDWYAQRLPDGFTLVRLQAQVIHTVVACQNEPPRTWLFRDADDRLPIVFPAYHSLVDLSSLDEAEAVRQQTANFVDRVGFSLDVFDDQGLLPRRLEK